MTDTGLPTETRDGFAPWHPVDGFNPEFFRLSNYDRDLMVPWTSMNGWRVLPVTITITATGTGSAKETPP